MSNNKAYQITSQINWSKSKKFPLLIFFNKYWLLLPLSKKMRCVVYCVRITTSNRKHNHYFCAYHSMKKEMSEREKNENGKFYNKPHKLNLCFLSVCVVLYTCNACVCIYWEISYLSNHHLLCCLDRIQNPKSIEMDDISMMILGTIWVMRNKKLVHVSIIFLLFLLYFYS